MFSTEAHVKSGFSALFQGILVSVHVNVECLKHGVSREGPVQTTALFTGLFWAPFSRANACWNPSLNGWHVVCMYRNMSIYIYYVPKPHPTLCAFNRKP